MRKILFLLLPLLILSSCGDDDSSSSNTENENSLTIEDVAGTWNIVDIRINDKSLDLSTCQSLEFIEISSDMTFTQAFFEPIESSPDTCGPAQFVNGTFEIISSDQGRVEFLDSSGNLDETITYSISLEDNNNTLKLTEIFSNEDSDSNTFLLIYSR
ncbi:hypothetical protein NBT05_16925 [Aquimarina sp. ERC-38]|uniref:hypothetical protein n=1 Tax=Aquimarina sp. ERC-38 TaxID=2949996 RepID=UPI002246BEBE|nr:hypothetical protein [Aquimarina sp. ERC-38]UZO80612.1 hypothetical protein NBT05_16925 [Aquimarina sp. ERC-38]